MRCELFPYFRKLTGLGFSNGPVVLLCSEIGEMGLMNIFKKPLTGDKSSNLIYDLLFCDDIELYKKHIRQPSVYPWNVLFLDRSTREQLLELIDNPVVETRAKILAYRKLTSMGQRVPRKELLAVIVEVGLDLGNDVLASFKDGTARYINQSGKIIIWEMTDRRSDLLTGELFFESDNIVKQIGPWDKQARLEPPAKGLARITFLVSDGLYFGQAPINDLFSDPLSGPALNAATLLMQHLTHKISIGEQ